jgi:L-ascorbate metabolism protein UlaG (beta-lactamase superfamily)
MKADAISFYWDKTMPVTVTFLGATTLLLDDGRTQLLTDGFFTRPRLLRVGLGRIAPDPEAVRAGLVRAGVERLGAVLVGHSHYDHALDAPEVCRQTGALLAGSASTLQVGRGWGLPEEQMRAIVLGETLTFGNFHVRFFPSSHSRPLRYPGVITSVPVPPVRASAFREGGTYAILIEHPAGNILVNESAGYMSGALDGVQAQVVMLSVGSLSRNRKEREAYFRETVLAVGAKMVVPVHYDNFFQRLAFESRLMPGTRLGLKWLARRVEREDGMKLVRLTPWTPAQLLQGG